MAPGLLLGLVMFITGLVFAELYLGNQRARTVAGAEWEGI